MVRIMKWVLILVSVMTLVSACAVKTRTEVEIPGVRVESGPAYNPGVYKHCPPGHAKKGWC